jgi:hypothetical protein
VTSLVLLGALFLLGVASSASAGPATDQVRVGVERVVKTLTDPALQGPERAAERRKAVRRPSVRSSFPCSTISSNVPT